jgi:PKD repeat protein
LSVSASTQGSTDPDGSVSKSTIDFGDGTVAAGPSASHTYAVTGSYDISATVFDNAGASAVAVQRMSVKATSPGVTVFTPGNGATVNWPTTLTASANSAAPIAMMKVLVDGQQVYAIDRDTIHTALKIFRGAHHVVVEATDNTGATSSTAFDVSAEPGDPTPTAVLQVLPMPAVAPNTVLACTANSVAPNGFFIKRQINFSDGAVGFGTGVLHSFAAPGSYSATAIVTDQFGATASASQIFPVNAVITVPAKTRGWPKPRYPLFPLRRP